MAEPEGACGLDVFLIFHGLDLDANDAGDGEPGESTDGDEEGEEGENRLELGAEVFDFLEIIASEPVDGGVGELVCPSAESFGEEDDDDEEGECVEDVHDAHEESVGAATGVACDGAPAHADADGDDGGDDADEDGDASAVEGS